MTMLAEKLEDGLESLRDRVDNALFRLRHRDEDGQALDLISKPMFRGPDIDIEDTDDAYIVKAELPGLKPEDFDVEVTADRLTIRGEKREEHEDKRRGVYRRELRYGSFARVLPLPGEIDPNRVNAQFDKGVLRLTLPKTEHSKARRISLGEGRQ